MYLFDEYLVWKTNKSKPNEIEVHIYQDEEEIDKDDVQAFQNKNYTLHDKTKYLAEIRTRKLTFIL